MKTTTRSLPCTPLVDGSPTFLPHTGVDVGPLFVHRTYHDTSPFNGTRPCWTVTHTPTGLAIRQDIRTKSRAMQLARRLKALDCWDFTEQERAKAIDPATLAEIRRLRDSV